MNEKFLRRLVWVEGSSSMSMLNFVQLDEWNQNAVPKCYFCTPFCAPPLILLPVTKRFIELVGGGNGYIIFTLVTIPSLGVIFNIDNKYVEECQYEYILKARAAKNFQTIIPK